MFLCIYIKCISIVISLSIMYQIRTLFATVAVWLRLKPKNNSTRHSKSMKNVNNKHKRQYLDYRFYILWLQCVTYKQACFVTCNAISNRCTCRVINSKASCMHSLCMQQSMLCLVIECFYRSRGGELFGGYLHIYIDNIGHVSVSSNNFEWCFGCKW